MMGQVEAHTLMQFPPSRQNFLGKPDVISPTLQMGAQTIGMSFFDTADINEMNIFTDLPRFPGLLQMQTISGTGQHPQFMVSCQTLDSGPAKIAFRTQEWIT